MPEYAHETRRLHAARLSPREFAEIEAALRLVFAPPGDSITWEFTRKKSRSNTGVDLETVILELADKSDITGFQVSAESSGTSDIITVTGGGLGCFVEYTSSQDRLSGTLRTIRLIEGVFKDRRRKRTHFFLLVEPRPFLEIGAKKEGLRVRWNAIAQEVITKALTYVATAAIAFIAGLLWARFS